MGFIKNKIKKYIDNIICEVIDEKYNNGDFCQHDWELIMANKIFKENFYGITSDKPDDVVKVYRCKKCGKEMRYHAREQNS